MKTARALISAKFAAWRAESGLSAEAAAEQLTAAMGGKWSRQTVLQAEKGARAWVVEDLLGVAQVMGTTVTELLSSDEPIQVGEWEATPAEVRRRTIGTEGRIEAGKAHFEDLVTLAQLLGRVETAYREMLSRLRYEFSVHPELLDHVSEVKGDLVKQHHPSLLESARNDVWHEFTLKGDPARGPQFDERVKQEVKLALLTIPAVRAANDALRQMKAGSWPEVDEERIQ